MLKAMFKAAATLLGLTLLSVICINIGPNGSILLITALTFGWWVADDTI